MDNKQEVLPATQARLTCAYALTVVPSISNEALAQPQTMSLRSWLRVLAWREKDAGISITWVPLPCW